MTSTGIAARLRPAGASATPCRAVGSSHDTFTLGIFWIVLVLKVMRGPVQLIYLQIIRYCARISECSRGRAAIRTGPLAVLHELENGLVLQGTLRKI